MKRAFILGISGGTWDVLEPLIRKGLVPHLSRLCAQGARGVLHSVRTEGDKHFRPQTAWPSLATGCSPDEHGITRFFHTAIDLKRETFWERLQKSGLTVGLYGWPMTWPVSPLSGFDVPCHHARDDETYPPGLQPRPARPGLAEKLRVTKLLARHHALLPVASRALGLASGRLRSLPPEVQRLQAAHLKQELACRLFLGLCRHYQTDVSAFVTFLADYVSHRYWRFHEPEKFARLPDPIHPRLTSAVNDAYITIDRFLGLILPRLSSDTVVAVVSEHGMAPEVETPEVGHWHYQIIGRELLRVAGLPPWIRIRPIARWLAFFAPPGQTLPPDTADQFRKFIVAETRRPLFQVYQHPHDRHGRQEVIVKFDLPADVYSQVEPETLTIDFQGRTLPFMKFARRHNHRRSAMHARDGVLILKGPGITPGSSLAPSSIVDFAPRFMNLLGFPFP